MSHDSREAEAGPIAAVWHEAAREPLMLVAAAGAVAAGLALRNPRLTRGGTRMLASQIVVAVGAVAARRLGGPDTRHGLPSWITAAMIERATAAALAALHKPHGAAEHASETSGLAAEIHSSVTTQPA